MPQESNTSHSLHDVALLFCDRVEPGRTHPSVWVMKVARSLAALLDQGWTLEGLAEHIRTFNGRAVTVEKMFQGVAPIQQKQRAPIPEGSLLEPGEIYLHSALRVPTRPPMMTMERDGSIRYVAPDKTLALRHSFTIDELVAYFHEQANIKPDRAIMQRDLGAAQYLLKHYSLDQVLFAIDIACEGFDKPAGLVQVEYFTTIAKERMEQVRAHYEEAGVIECLRYQP